jgi:hydroxymethylglutaryl-CoA synthase
MSGIRAYGAYIPRYRLDRKLIYAATGFLGASPMQGEKAVANYDEDSITMAVAAGCNCLGDLPRSVVQRLYFATTTPPYQVRQNSAIIAGALDLIPRISTSDITGCTKSGTGALLAALGALQAEEQENVLVTAADCRVGKPGGPQEYLYGDGAAAILIGNDDVLATFEGHYSVTYDFPDRWRSEEEKFEHVWEDRFIKDEGYTRFIPQAVSGLMSKYGLNSNDIAKVVFPCIYPREYAAIGKQLGMEPAKLQGSMLDMVGETGSASPLLMMAAALDKAKPGDRIVLASYGSGSDALLFKVTDKIESAGNRDTTMSQVASKRQLSSYEKYLAFRNAMPMDLGIRGEVMQATPLSALYRERKQILSLCGSRCRSCGTPQFPANRICVNPDCLAVDQMDEYRFSDKKAVVFSYTSDNLAPSVSPPSIYGLIDFDGGGRFWFDFTDCDPESVHVGTPLRMTFRRKYVDKLRGIHGYFWKAVPASA